MAKTFTNNGYLKIEYPPYIYDDEIFNIIFRYNITEDVISHTTGFVNGTGISYDPNQGFSEWHLIGYPDYSFDKWTQEFSFATSLGISFAFYGSIYNLGTNKVEFNIFNFGGTWGAVGDNSGEEPISIFLQSFNNRLTFNIFDDSGTRHYFDSLPLSDLFSADPLGRFMKMVSLSFDAGTWKVYLGSELLEVKKENPFNIMPVIAPRIPRFFVQGNNGTGTIDLGFKYFRMNVGTLDPNIINTEWQRLMSTGLSSADLAFNYNQIQKSISIDGGFEQLSSIEVEVKPTQILEEIIENRSILDSDAWLMLFPKSDWFFQTFFGYIDSIEYSYSKMKFTLIDWIKKLGDIVIKPDFHSTKLAPNPWKDVADYGTMYSMDKGTIIFEYNTAEHRLDRLTTGMTTVKQFFDVFFKWQAHQELLWKFETGFMGSEFHNGNLVCFATKSSSLSDLEKNPPTKYFTIVNSIIPNDRVTATVILDDDPTIYGFNVQNYNLWFAFPKVIKGDAVDVFRKLISDPSITYTLIGTNIFDDSFYSVKSGIFLEFPIEPFQPIGDLLSEIMKEGFFSVVGVFNKQQLRAIKPFPYPGTIYDLGTPFGRISLMERERIDSLRVDTSSMNDSAFKSMSYMGNMLSGKRSKVFSPSLINNVSSGMNYGIKKLLNSRIFTKKFELRYPLETGYYKYKIGDYLKFSSPNIPLSGSEAATCFISGINIDFQNAQTLIEAYDIRDIEKEGNFGIFKRAGTIARADGSYVLRNSDFTDDWSTGTAKYWNITADGTTIKSHGRGCPYNLWANTTNGSIKISQTSIENIEADKVYQLAFYIRSAEASNFNGSLNLYDTDIDYVSYPFSISIGADYSIFSIEFCYSFSYKIEIELASADSSGTYSLEISEMSLEYTGSKKTIYPVPPDTVFSSFNGNKTKIHSELNSYMDTTGTLVAETSIDDLRASFPGRIIKIGDELMRVIQPYEDVKNPFNSLKVERGIFGSPIGTHQVPEKIWNLDYFIGGTISKIMRKSTFNFW